MNRRSNRIQKEHKMRKWIRWEIPRRKCFEKRKAIFLPISQIGYWIPNDDDDALFFWSFQTIVPKSVRMYRTNHIENVHTLHTQKTPEQQIYSYKWRPHASMIVKFGFKIKADIIFREPARFATYVMRRKSKVDVDAKDWKQNNRRTTTKNRIFFLLVSSFSFYII